LRKTQQSLLLEKRVKFNEEPTVVNYGEKDQVIFFLSDGDNYNSKSRSCTPEIRNRRKKSIKSILKKQEEINHQDENEGHSEKKIKKNGHIVNKNIRFIHEIQDCVKNGKSIRKSKERTKKICQTIILQEI